MMLPQKKTHTNNVQLKWISQGENFFTKILDKANCLKKNQQKKYLKKSVQRWG